MKVLKLISVLLEMDSQAEVIMAADEEGNGFSKLGCAESINKKYVLLWPGGVDLNIEEELSA